jgi:hypothetical protein
MPGDNFQKRHVKKRDDNASPKKNNKKKSKSGMSTGLILGILAGAGALIVLVLCLGVGGIVYFFSGSGPNLGNTPGLTAGKLVSLQPGAGHFDRMTLEREGKRHKITVESDPASDIEIVVEMAVMGGKSNREVIGQTRRSGKTCTLSFTAPGFGEVPFRVINHGAAATSCRIAHDGLP